MYDVIIIGSGFGGSIPAYELSKSGFSVCLIERGPWRKSANLEVPDENTLSPLPQGIGLLRNAIMRVHHPILARKGLTINKKGLFDIHIAGDMNVLCSSSVGGGSHVYGGLHGYPLQADYWDNIASNLSSGHMQAHYDKVVDLLGSHKAPQRDLPDNHYTVPSFTDVPASQQPLWGYARHLKNTDGWHQQVNFSKEGMFGSPSGHKTTLDKCLLLPAINKHKLVVRACHEAVAICQHDGYFDIEVIDHIKKRHSMLQARKVILAAGCINTIRLLHHSISVGGLPQMPALGKRFSGNADMVAFWHTSDHAINHPAFGPYERLLAPIAKNIPLQIIHAGVAGLSALPLPHFIKRWLRGQSFLAAMGIDNANGEIRFRKNALVINYDEKKNPIIGSIKKSFEAIALASRKRVFFSKALSTVHPLGGATISDNPLEGVIDGNGTVHGVSNLFITDSSVFPKALGAPPSLSIAAWASHVSEQLILST